PPPTPASGGQFVCIASGGLSLLYQFFDITIENYGSYQNKQKCQSEELCLCISKMRCVFQNFNSTGTHSQPFF
ncbi:MAG TPA: hypothetical protein ACFYDZ_04230, partial [Candidatus Brocadiaceae bacterium]